MRNVKPKATARPRNGAGEAPEALPGNRECHVGLPPRPEASAAELGAPLDLGQSGVTGLLEVRARIPLPDAEMVPLPKHFAFHSATHGQFHVARVLIHGMRLIAATGQQDETLRFWASAYLHDLGRSQDWEEPGHGRNAVKRLREMPEVMDRFRRAGLTDEDLPAIGYAVARHSEGEPSPDHPAYRLALLLKDADGLDRVRIDDLDTSYLRHPEAKGMATYAQALCLESYATLGYGEKHFAGLWDLATRLDARQSKMASPAFEAWFKGSQVLDEFGGPMLVYHGGKFDPAKQGVPITDQPGRKGFQLPFGMHFAEDIAEAKTYLPRSGGSMTRAYLALRNPLKLVFGHDKHGDLVTTPITAEFHAAMPGNLRKHYDAIYGDAMADTPSGHGFQEWLEAPLERLKPGEARQAVLDMGFDGVIYEARANHGNGSYRPFRGYIAMRPEQIKVPDVNLGTFDPSNPDVRG